MRNYNNYLTECFPAVPRPWLVTKPKSGIAFYCCSCGDVIYDYEVEAFDCYEAPGGALICYSCVASMTVEEVLALMGCKKLPIGWGKKAV